MDDEDVILYRYTYDDLGQLIREDNRALNKSYTWTYDNAGNRLTQKTYAFTTGTLGTATRTQNYTYETSAGGWADKLTSFGLTYGDEDGEYDNGNPTGIYGYANLIWQGRELVEYYDWEDGYSYTYTYNDEGIRTSKTIEGVLHEYILNGSQIIAEKWENNLLIYIYDEAGSPIGLMYRNSTYASGVYDSFFFEKNLQGDVIAVYDATGTKIGSYTYDAWGNFTTTVTSGNTTLENNIVRYYNPFRYRSYFYDTETGWYYLQSRYYVPSWGRFLNADGVAYLGANGDMQSYNLFAYCSNNPVMGYDPTGTWNWGKFISGVDLLAVGVAAIAVSATILTCGAAAPAMIAVAAVTMTAGVATTVNGVAEVVEAGTGYNFVQETVFNGDSDAYEAYRDITKLLAETGTAICGTYYAYKGGNVCFVAGTMIASGTGQVPIEDIEAGDLVWATDSETGETALKRVVQTFRNETTELIHVTVNGEEIICTSEHPFYSPVRGWVAACQLRAGDILVTLNGEYVAVERVQHEILENPVAVYNFEVEGFHTYYVSNTQVLVHNTCSIKDGDLKAIVNRYNETEAPHAHILRNGKRVSKVDINGTIIKGSQDKDIVRFISKHKEEIIELIKQNYPKKV